MNHLWKDSPTLSEKILRTNEAWALENQKEMFEEYVDKN